MIPAVILWSIMSAAVAGLALYRKFVAYYKEDDLIHVGPGEEKLISQQVEVTRTLDKVDKFGKVLTLATVAMGLVLLGVYLYGVWMESMKLPE